MQVIAATQSVSFVISFRIDNLIVVERENGVSVFSFERKLTFNFG